MVEPKKLERQFRWFFEKRREDGFGNSASTFWGVNLLVPDCVPTSDIEKLGIPLPENP